MDNTPPDRKGLGLAPPSESHGEAIGSVIYRLSELMFGSLLASYVLGFIGFSIPHTARLFSDGDVSTFYPEVLTYLFISMSFAYLTAGLYISYHAGILTMPHLPFSNLRWDFLVALLQSVFFGISMLLPLWFPLCVGCVLLVASARQHIEYRALVYKLRKTIKPVQSSVGAGNLRDIDNVERQEKQSRKRGSAEFRKLFNSELERAQTLKSWWKVSRRTALGAVALVMVGVFLVIFEYYNSELQWTIGIGLPVLAGISFLFIMMVVNRVLADRANFMYNDVEKKVIDTQFWSLVDGLHKGSVDAPKS